MLSSKNANSYNWYVSLPDGISGWSQGVMGGHLMHQSMSDPASYSQHQTLERDDTGIVAPSNTFHQPVPSNFMDYNKVSQSYLCFK